MEENQTSLKQTLSADTVDGKKLKDMSDSLKKNVKEYHTKRITELKPPPVTGGGYKSRKNSKKSKKTSRKNK